VTNLETTKPSVIALFITDALLLIIMLAGLLRLRDGGSLVLWRLLWKQVGAGGSRISMAVMSLMRSTFVRVSSGLLFLSPQNSWNW
jgi:hypothetical protein